ncbi:MAG: NUDIX hydrolase [Candidatus Omnitrophica bacterium]|nr:NUDIX hydrolase [Candidatus Omnitrophota bacterium]
MKKPLVGPRNLVYENPYQKIFRVEAHFGQFSKEYYVLATGRKAGIVVIRGDQVLLVRQYRLLIDQVSWEIPGGKVDEHETPAEAAVRECFEESGIQCSKPLPLLFYQPGLDTSDNPTYLFFTDNFSETVGNSHFHPDEVCDIEWIPLSRCIDMIGKHDIVDSFSIIALLAYQSHLLGHLTWSDGVDNG